MNNEFFNFDKVIEIESQKWYNQALEDLWKLATLNFDEVMDFQDLAECIKELKK